MTSALRRGGWSAPRPGHFTPRKDPVPIAQEVGWAPGTVWTGAENLSPTEIRSPDRPARSESLYRLSYPGPWFEGMYLRKLGFRGRIILSRPLFAVCRLHTAVSCIMRRLMEWKKERKTEWRRPCNMNVQSYTLYTQPLYVAAKFLCMIMV